MNYREYQEYFNSLGKKGIRLGLDRVAKVLDHLGNPQARIPAVHIAGTNGKGSTAAFTESILRAAGWRVGLYTSPHLLDFRERIQINRALITPDEVARLASMIKQATDDLSVPLTGFEFATVLAFAYFAEQLTDINVIEVGLGGRLDATNLCSSRISIITALAKDHMEYLGEAIHQIAFEKASIIKDYGTVVADSQEASAMAVIEQMAAERKAVLKIYGRDFSAQRTSFKSSSQLIDYIEDSEIVRDLTVPLLGRHQVTNAALAIAACRELFRHGLKASGGGADVGSSPVFTSSLRTGVAACRWDGRLEVVAVKPTILLDGAHNPSGAKILTEAIREYFKFDRCILVFGVMRDKSVREMAGLLASIADRIILVKPHQERSFDPRELRSYFDGFNKHIEIIDEISYAVVLAKKVASPDSLICVTGSLFTVAEAKAFLLHEKDVQAPNSHFDGDVCGAI